MFIETVHVVTIKARCILNFLHEEDKDVFEPLNVSSHSVKVTANRKENNQEISDSSSSSQEHSESLRFIDHYFMVLLLFCAAG